MAEERGEKSEVVDDDETKRRTSPLACFDRVGEAVGEGGSVRRMGCCAAVLMLAVWKSFFRACVWLVKRVLPVQSREALVL